MPTVFGTSSRSRGRCAIYFGLSGDGHTELFGVESDGDCSHGVDYDDGMRQPYGSGFQFSLYSLFVVVTLAALLFGYSRFRPEFGIRFAAIYGFAAIIFGLTILIGAVHRKFKPPRR